jgi:hypothetical protein
LEISCHHHHPHHRLLRPLVPADERSHPLDEPRDRSACGPLRRSRLARLAPWRDRGRLGTRDRADGARLAQHLVDFISMILFKSSTFPAWVEELRCFDRRLREAGVVHSVIFSAPRPIETMFETSAIAYLDPPRAADVARVEEKGYAALVYQPGRLVSLGSIAPMTLDCSLSSGSP